MAKDQENKQTFEQALAQLEKIVSEVEQGEIGLEEPPPVTCRSGRGDRCGSGLPGEVCCGGACS